MFVCNCSSYHVQLTGNCKADAMPTGLHADELRPAFCFAARERHFISLGAVGHHGCTSLRCRHCVRYVLPTHRGWSRQHHGVGSSLPGLASLRGQADPQDGERKQFELLPAIAITYLQVCVGAVMRHTRSGLACGFDFPLCLGKVWPVDAHLGVQLHMFHRAGGCLTAAVVIALAVAILHRETAKPALRILATLGAVAVLAQIALGIATILTSRELVTMTLHSSLGAALLACLVAVYWIACPSAPPPRTHRYHQLAERLDCSVVAAPSKG